MFFLNFKIRTTYPTIPSAKFPVIGFTALLKLGSEFNNHSKSFFSKEIIRDNCYC